MKFQSCRYDEDFNITSWYIDGTEDNLQKYEFTTDELMKNECHVLGIPIDGVVNSYYNGDERINNNSNVTFRNWKVHCIIDVYGKLYYIRDTYTTHNNIEIIKNCTGGLIFYNYDYYPVAFVSSIKNKVYSKYKDKLDTTFIKIANEYQYLAYYDSNYYIIDLSILLDDKYTNLIELIDKIGECQLYAITKNKNDSVYKNLYVSFNGGIIIPAPQVSVISEEEFTNLDYYMPQALEKLGTSIDNIMISPIGSKTQSGLAFYKKQTVYIGNISLNTEDKDVEDIKNIIKFLKNNYKSTIVKRKFLSLESPDTFYDNSSGTEIELTSVSELLFDSKRTIWNVLTDFIRCICTFTTIYCNLKHKDKLGKGYILFENIIYNAYREHTPFELMDGNLEIYIEGYVYNKDKLWLVAYIEDKVNNDRENNIDAMPYIFIPITIR